MATAKKKPTKPTKPAAKKAPEKKPAAKKAPVAAPKKVAKPAAKPAAKVAASKKRDFDVLDYLSNDFYNRSEKEFFHKIAQTLEENLGCHAVQFFSFTKHKAG